VREEITTQHPVRRRFGEYEVQRDGRGRLCMLGTGSYGRTYRARHALLGTEVAIKVIRREVVASESVRQRFLAEGRALTELFNDRVAMLRHFGQTEHGELYCAMEFCAGGTLTERIRKMGPRPVGEALEIVRQVAEALKAAHAAGIVHRDLKPNNVMLAGTPPPLQTKVIDFGLAQGSGGSGGRFRGTVQWASPEQLREEPIDGRSDLFSLGLILWYLLDGHAPDDAETADIVRRRLTPGHYAARLPNEIPEVLCALLAGLLETDPGKRFGSADELIAIIDELHRTHPYDPVPEPDPDEDELEADELPYLSADIQVDERYFSLTRLHRDLAGEWFEAELADDGGNRIVFVLDERWSRIPALRRRVKTNIARLTRTLVEGLPSFWVLQETDDNLLAEWDGESVGDLASWLKLRRRLDLKDAMGFLAGVAQVADEAAEAGIPGVGLSAGQVRWESGTTTESTGGLARAVPFLFPLLLDAGDLPGHEGPGPDANGSTIVLVVPELACDRCYMLAALIYRMISGREPATAIAHSPAAYAPISGLTEQGNMMLRDALTRDGEIDTCTSLLRALAGAEGMSFIGSTVGRARRSSGSTRRPATSGDVKVAEAKTREETLQRKSEERAEQERKEQDEREAAAREKEERRKQERKDAAERAENELQEKRQHETIERLEREHYSSQPGRRRRGRIPDNRRGLWWLRSRTSRVMKQRALAAAGGLLLVLGLMVWAGYADWGSPESKAPSGPKNGKPAPAADPLPQPAPGPANGTDPETETEEKPPVGLHRDSGL